MAEFTIDGRLFKQFMGIIDSSKVEEVVLSLSQKHVIARAIGPAQSSLLHIEIFQNSLTNYLIETEEHLKLDVDILKKIASKWNEGDEIHIKYDKEFIISFMAGEKKTDFFIQEFDLRDEEFLLKGLEINEKIKINLFNRDLLESLERILIISEKATIKTENMKFLIKGETVLGKADANIPLHESSKGAIDQILLSIETLKNVLQNIDLDSQITVSTTQHNNPCFLFTLRNQSGKGKIIIPAIESPIN